MFNHAIRYTLVLSCVLCMGYCLSSCSDKSQVEDILASNDMTSIPEWTPPAPTAVLNKANQLCNISGPVMETINGIDIIYTYSDLNVGMMYIYIRDPINQECRVIKLYNQNLASNCSGFVAVIEELEVHKFGVEFWWYNIEGDGGGFTEWTTDNYLSCELSPVAGGLSKEDYLWDGKPSSYTFNLATVAADTAMSVDFNEFYPGNDSLNNNYDGILLMSLLSSEDFVFWLGDQYGHTQEEILGWRDVVDIGGTVKCLFGGLSNPVCCVYTGFVIGEAIGNIIREQTQGW